jgi:threonine dehydratase
MIPTADQITAAHNRIRPYIHETPVLTSENLNNLGGAQIFFKCENFQKIGAFKARGAYNAALSLPATARLNGLATHSSGNHAQAVALAAKKLGTKAYIVMPENAPKVKIESVQAYGASITFCKPTLAAREENLSKIVKQTGAFFIHPYNDYDVIAGQATCSKELLAQVDHLDYMLCPVGGGGLLSGTLLSAKYYYPSCKVIAGEPEGADDAYQSWINGKLVPSNNPKTIADGLLTSLGDNTWPIIKEHVHGIVTVSDIEIIHAMRLIWERLKIIIEPSCAVPFAVLLKDPTTYRDQRIGIILTGGNVDLDGLPF